MTFEIISFHELHATYHPASASTKYTNSVLSAYGQVYLWQGLRRDPDTGLYHARHRDVSPTLGRPLQRDPIGFEAGYWASGVKGFGRAGLVAEQLFGDHRELWFRCSWLGCM